MNYCASLCRAGVGEGRLAASKQLNRVLDTHTHSKMSVTPPSQAPVAEAETDPQELHVLSSSNDVRCTAVCSSPAHNKPAP